MNFTSFGYFLFLPIVLATFLAVSDRFRWIVLLLASLLFYGSLKSPYLLAALAFVAVTTHVTAQQLSREGLSAGKRQMFFWSGVCLNLSVLIILRYMHPLAKMLFPLMPGGAVNGAVIWSGLVTIGVSYFVFQAISYLADVYLGTVPPERNFGQLALYLCFFPKLLQGPIERADALLPQLRAPYHFDYDTARSGLALFAWGLFKKVVVADRLGVMVDTVYGNLHDYRGVMLLLATYLYAVQIYCDFSGYTDMALGTARLFNIRLSRNFNSPYLANSVADFWRRWHITFSSWILDYIFKPLQLAWRDWRSLGTVAALLVTFLVSGIWHGASWGFVIWGLLHGIFLSAATLYRPYQKKLQRKLGVSGSEAYRWWQVFVTFNLVCFAWVFFRAASLPDAWYLVSHLMELGNSGLTTFIVQQKKLDLVIILLTLPLLAFLHLRGEEVVFNGIFKIELRWKRWGIYAGLAVLLILFRVDRATTFIYFQF